MGSYIEKWKTNQSKQKYGRILPPPLTPSSSRRLMERSTFSSSREEESHSRESWHFQVDSSITMRTLQMRLSESSKKRQASTAPTPNSFVLKEKREEILANMSLPLRSGSRLRKMPMSKLVMMLPPASGTTLKWSSQRKRFHSIIWILSRNLLKRETREDLTESSKNTSQYFR